VEEEDLQQLSPPEEHAQAILLELLQVEAVVVVMEVISKVE
jgi:hypothetical protein